MTGFLICFSGIDGSGKTTQAKMLVDRLNKNGFKTKYVWNCFNPLLMKPFWVLGKLIIFHGNDMYQNYSGYSKKKRMFSIIELYHLFFSLCISLIIQYKHYIEYGSQ